MKTIMKRCEELKKVKRKIPIKKNAKMNNDNMNN